MNATRLTAGITLSLILCALCVSPALGGAPGATAVGRTASDQLSIAKTRLGIATDAALIAMDATIDYVGDIGGDTVALKDIRNKFAENAEKAQNAKTFAELRTYSAALRTNGTTFIATAQAEIKKHGGTPIDLLGYIQAAFADHPVLTKLTPAERSIIAQVVGDRYDTLTVKGEQLLMRLSTAGYDVTDAQETLDAIKDLKDDLTTAIKSGTAAELQHVTTEILTLVKEFKGELPELPVP
ncbi:MAG: hypothetical protein NT074_05580 [Methanomicrobiales archaeon]|nr:hypothetical protein [Methanomicrobiales archaeon]